jgi:hypothetical protein
VNFLQAKNDLYYVHELLSFDIVHFKVNGIARDFVLSGLNLHDGVTYYVTVISCNGAKICTSSTSSGILVDSTPPTRGMYLSKTEILMNNLQLTFTP